MSRLAFRRIRIDRYLGITSGFELRALAPGVNIVYGPNASGKTTTARAIETLLWPKVGRSHGVVVEAAVDVAGDPWTVRVNADRVDHERDGVPAEPMPTAPSDARDRYRLWLSDLLRSDDGEFAKRIVIESAGGYDLRNAANSAFQAWRAAPRRGKPHDDLLRARRAKAEATAAAAVLEEERTTLAEKEERLGEQSALLARAHACRLALDLLARRAALARAKADLAVYPPNLVKLQGDEAAEVSRLRERIADARGKAERAEAARMEALRSLQRLGLPAAVVEGDLFSRLKADLDRLTDLDRDLAQLESRQEEEAARVTEVERRLGRVDRVQLAELDPEGLGNLLAAGRRAEAVRQERVRLESELTRLPGTPPPRDLEQYVEGLHLLRDWLAGNGREGPSDRLRLAAIVGAGAGVAGGVGVIVWGPVWVGLIVLLAALGAVGILYIERNRAELQVDREQKYLKLGLLLAPDAWETTSVEACVAALDASIAEGRRLERDWARRLEVQGELESLRRSQPAPEARVQELAEFHGLQLPDDTVVAHALVEDLIAWRNAKDALRAAEARQVATFRTRQGVLEAANRRLRQIGKASARESQEVRGTVEKLSEDLAAHREATRGLDDAKADRKRAEESIVEYETALAAIRERAGFTDAEEHLLAEWCAAVPACREAVRAVTGAEAQLRLVQEQITGTVGFDRRLPSMPAEELKAEIARIEQELEELQDLAKTVGSLRERIRVASTGHTLEDALAAEREALAALREMRERSLRSAVAEALVDYVDRETRRAHQPKVLKRANELLGVITRHAYELRVDDVESGSFRAIDKRTDRGHSLDELSNGTRVQLLLAVRLAFVESLETGVALPLLMDETLANSDDERAAAIMEAVIRLAEAGRQVFYFTAQPDEVAKWCQALGTANVEWTRIDLAEVRALDGRLDPDLPEPSAPPAPLALPRGVRHVDIPRHLHVPRLSLDGSIASVHPWYLTEDVALLEYLVNELRVATWGELNALIETSGESLLEPAVRERLVAMVGATRSVIAGLKVGRGRPVDRGALVDSDAVTKRYIDEVDALSASFDGNAVRLVEALENHAIKGFRQRNADELRAFLEEHGQYDDRPRLNFAEIRQRVIAERAEDLATATLSATMIDRLIVRVSRGAGVDVEVPSMVPQIALF